MTETRPDDATLARDPQRPVRLLRTEHDALLPILRQTPEEAFGNPTACPGWSVRDVLAHCAAALTRVATGTLHSFTPELNEIDVAQRRDWPLPRLLSELERGYLEAGPVIGEAGGRLDPIALGEWIHGGDVRGALDEPLAYESDGFEDACALLAEWTRRLKVPLTEVDLPGTALRLGVPVPGRPEATLVTDRATLMRLFAGRPAEPAEYQLTGAVPEDLVVF
ncbi:MAG: maleylpyruvate isomerase family mycothiol-dependent enzyme [Streptosporangiaceae bacterium]